MQQPQRGRRRHYCNAACRSADYRSRKRVWGWVQAHDPQRAALPADDMPGRVPRPDKSTVDDVTQTLLAAMAVCAELRRHSIAAAPQLGARCGVVAAALDGALAESFGEVLKTAGGLALPAAAARSAGATEPPLSPASDR